MTLDYPKHKSILLQILKDIFTDTSLAPSLGFKGGTAAMLFYGLDRHSVDIDLDLLDVDRQAEVFEKVRAITLAYGKEVDAHVKRNGLLLVISYNDAAQNIKVEINTRNFGSRYEIKTLLGIPMRVMVQADMFANKLMAMHERIGKTSRDIYDVHFFLKGGWPINREIVERRSDKPFGEALRECIEQLEVMSNSHILDGLGEMIDDPKKDWARAKLKDDTIFLLKVMGDF